MLLPSGNPFKCHEEVLYFQLLIPPKRFDIFFPLTGGCSEGLGAFRFFFKHIEAWLFRNERKFRNRTVLKNQSNSFYEFTSLRVLSQYTRCACLGPDVEHPITRYQPLDYSRILPWLIVRPCPTLGSVVALQRCPRIWGQPGRPGVSQKGHLCRRCTRCCFRHWGCSHPSSSEGQGHDQRYRLVQPKRSEHARTGLARRFLRVSTWNVDMWFILAFQM